MLNLLTKHVLFPKNDAERQPAFQAEVLEDRLLLTVINMPNNGASDHYAFNLNEVSNEIEIWNVETNVLVNTFANAGQNFVVNGSDNESDTLTVRQSNSFAAGTRIQFDGGTGDDNLIVEGTGTTSELDYSFDPTQGSAKSVLDLKNRQGNLKARVNATNTEAFEVVDYFGVDFEFVDKSATSNIVSNTRFASDSTDDAEVLTGDYDGIAFAPIKTDTVRDIELRVGPESTAVVTDTFSSNTEEFTYRAFNVLTGNFQNAKRLTVLPETLGANIRSFTDTTILTTDSDVTVPNTRVEGFDRNVDVPRQSRLRIFGGSSDNVMDATGNQFLNIQFFGNGGNDTLTGGAKNDLLNGGSGNDTISGSHGDDQIFGEFGDDTLNGDSDDDTINAGPGDDTVSGGTGDDTLNGQEGNDFLVGSSGDDSISGGDGEDRLEGQLGDDELRGGNDQDELFGGDGIDKLFGGDSSDLLNGGNGADELTGGTGNDRMFGGADEDVLLGNQGLDRMFGGSGNDSVNGGGDDDFVDGGAGDDTLLGGPGSDKLFGKDGDDTLEGGIGDDLFEGGLGSDVIRSGDGDNLIRFFGTDNEDVIRFSLIQPGEIRGILRDTANTVLERDRFFIEPTTRFEVHTLDGDDRINIDLRIEEDGRILTGLGDDRVTAPSNWTV